MNKRKTGAQLDYDARKLPDSLSWTRFGFAEDAGWCNACSAAGETAFWKLRLQKIPEGAIHENITPTPIATQRAGWQVFDAGRIVSGWVKIRAGAPKGTRICIRYSEYLEQNVVSKAVGSLRQLSDTYCDYYTFSGEENESFAADFGYRAFRYFEIVGMPHLLHADQVTVQWASTAMEQTAFFTSSIAIYSSISNCAQRYNSLSLASGSNSFALLNSPLSIASRTSSCVEKKLLYASEHKSTHASIKFKVTISTINPIKSCFIIITFTLFTFSFLTTDSTQYRATNFTF
jgi:hypothetical protein